jgi:small subunit ribosomal protein S1
MTEEKQTTGEKAPLQTSYSARSIEVGDMVVGTILKMAGSIAFVDFGGRNQGYIELSELKDEQGEVIVKEGDEIQAQVTNTRGATQLSYKKAQVGQAIESLKEAFKAQTPVPGEIVATNKGGYEVRINGVRAFCPNSQLANRFVQNPAQEVGKSYEFQITEFKDAKSIVVSRRVLLESQQAEVRANLSDRIRTGDRIQGTVT